MDKHYQQIIDQLPENEHYDRCYCAVEGDMRIIYSGPLVKTTLRKNFVNKAVCWIEL